jgi:hypothetical protein
MFNETIYLMKLADESDNYYYSKIISQIFLEKRFRFPKNENKEKQFK